MNPPQLHPGPSILASACLAHTTHPRMQDQGAGCLPPARPGETSQAAVPGDRARQLRPTNPPQTREQRARDSQGANTPSTRRVPSIASRPNLPAPSAHPTRDWRRADLRALSLVPHIAWTRLWHCPHQRSLHASSGVDGPVPADNAMTATPPTRHRQTRQHAVRRNATHPCPLGHQSVMSRQAPQGRPAGRRFAMGARAHP